MVPPAREPFERSPGLQTVAIMVILLVIGVAAMAFALSSHPVTSIYNCPVPDAYGNLPSEAPEECRP